MEKKVVAIGESKILKKYQDLVNEQMSNAKSADSAWHNVTHDKGSPHNQTTHAQTGTPPFVNSTSPRARSGHENSGGGGHSNKAG